MTVTVSSFKAAYPEFGSAGDILIAAKLEEAELTTSDSFGDQYDYAVMLLTADLLASSPWGRDARMISEDQRTSTYATRLWSLRRANAVRALRFGVED